MPPWLPATALAVLLFLLHSVTRPPTGPPLWSPVMGSGLVLVAWFGWRLGLAALSGAGLLLLARHFFQLLAGETAAGFLAVAVEAALLVAGPLGIWWLVRDLARGSRLLDPRSAMLFVLLAPGVGAAATALVRAGFDLALQPAGTAGEPFASLFVAYWLGDALAMMALAPPLLVLGTPWLARHGLTQPEPAPNRSGPGVMIPPDAGVGNPWRWGDWLEIGGLALGATILCLLLSGLHGRRELLGWHFWGVQLLLIVWASLRQGLAGGTVVAGVAAAVSLTLRPLWVSADLDDPLFRPLLQAHLLAQCAAAVLISASSSWVRRNEAGYRQVVSHVPVVIYSARLTQPRRTQDDGLTATGDATRTDGQHRPEPPVGPGQGKAPAAPHPASPVPDAEVTLVSAASAQMLGCRAEELVGDHQRWLALVHPDDREVVLAALGQLARQDQPVTCEYRLAASEPPSWKRGQATFESARKFRWLRDIMAPHRDGEGRLIGWEGVVTDVTPQRILADDLRRTTSLFNALISNLPTGVFFIQSPHGQPILVNARARQLLGQREDTSAGLDQLSRTYRLFRSDGTPYPVEELPVYLALRHGRTTMRDDIVVHRPDGRRVPLITWGAPIQLGGLAGSEAAVWVLEDLTALHQAEAARKDSEGRLRAVIETMAEGLIVLDARGHVVTTNPASCALFNLPPERLRGRPLGELGWGYRREEGAAMPVEEHPAVVALRTGRPVRNVLLGVQPEDASPEEKLAGLSVRWLLVNAMPLASGPGQAPAGVVATFSDLSAYVQAREAIRISEERYRTLVDSLPVMLVQSDRELRVTYINPATERITGYSLEELTDPASWSSLVQAEDLPRIFEVLRQALDGGVGRAEVRYRARDGSEKAAFLLAQPRAQGGAVVGTTCIVVDVTRERQLVQELQRSQRLELIGRLSSGVAHDFNNLLGVVLNLADLARNHLAGDHPVHADLRRITEAGEQAAALAGQLLGLARQRPGSLRRIEINRVVRRTLELLRATLPGSIQVESELCEEDLPIQGDETQVQQVLMNLCLNARDALAGGGRLSVRTARSREPAEARLVVEDSGTGMSESVRARIFEPFYSTKENGTGLGLAVVQQIIESYGGRIEVTSRPGAGSRFEVAWPTVDAKANTDPR